MDPDGVGRLLGIMRDIPSWPGAAWAPPSMRHPVFTYRISYRGLDVQARLLAAVLVGEVPEHVAMVTR